MVKPINNISKSNKAASLIPIPTWWQQLKTHPFFIKLLSWEYWPLHLIYLPIYCYAIYLAIKARSLFFFAAANPNIDMGGLFNERKSDVYKQMPAYLYPKTLLVTPNKTSLADMEAWILKSQLSYPLICKPDMGERGLMVAKVNNKTELQVYFVKSNFPFLLQEFVPFEEEIGVLHYRFPNEKKGHITSFTLKEFLSVTGNGKDTVAQLMAAYPRAKLQIDRLTAEQPNTLKKVLAQGEKLLLEPIGNHCRGTAFLNGSQHIDAELLAAFDKISKELNGIYFGRYDIRCKSIESLKQGKDFKILEINGVKAEPTHIYHPGASLLAAYKVLFKQWRIIYDLSMTNKKAGATFPSFTEGWKQVKAHFAHRKEM